MLACTLILVLTGIVAAFLATYHTPRQKRRLAGLLIDAANSLVAHAMRLYASADADVCRRQCYEQRSAFLLAECARQGKEAA